METKSLLIGIVSFIAGGLLVSIAATTFEKDEITKPDSVHSMGMMQGADTLGGKTGDDFDKAFITEMIEHHEGAVDMAKMADRFAEHDEIKQLSRDIITAQEKEITQMKQWQQAWGYDQSSQTMMGH